VGRCPRSTTIGGVGHGGRRGGTGPRSGLEACYGWYWALTCSQAEGAGCIWSNRSACMGHTRVKNDVKDAPSWPTGLRRNDVPEAWIARGGTPVLRSWCAIGQLTGLAPSPSSDTCGDGQAGPCLPGRDVRPSAEAAGRMDFPRPYGLRVESRGTCWRSTTGDRQVEREIARWLKDDPRLQSDPSPAWCRADTAAILWWPNRRHAPIPPARDLVSGGDDPKLHESDTQPHIGPDHQAGLDDRTMAWVESVAPTTASAIAPTSDSTA